MKSMPKYPRQETTGNELRCPLMPMCLFPQSVQFYRKYVTPPVLEKIELLTPKSAEYFYRNYRKGHLAKRWNLYITDEMAGKEEDACAF
ncbi:MAG: hypothetical protein MJ025_05065 [Victivallaceae bacterium]|nr:hypothetical protein [Victivallaceae bacterium]